MADYNPSLRHPYGEHDLKRAEALLVQAGYPHGVGLPPIEFLTKAGSAGRLEAEYFQKSMRKIGVNVQVKSYAWPQFLDAIRNKRSQIWQIGWAADYPYAESMLQLFLSKNGSPGTNDANYKNPAYDALYDELEHCGHGQKQAKKRAAIIDSMVALLNEDLPWLVGVHHVNYMLLQPDVDGVLASPFDHSVVKYYRRR